jgi:hypothetical protein
MEKLTNREKLVDMWQNVAILQNVANDVANDPNMWQMPQNVANLVALTQMVPTFSCCRF